MEMGTWMMLSEFENHVMRMKTLYFTNFRYIPPEILTFLKSACIYQSL
jgi:hypothetical protein